MEEKDLKVSEMTVSDVCKTQLFNENLENVMNEWRRAKLEVEVRHPVKRHAYDRLCDKHLFEPHYMRNMYIDVINKVSKFPSDIRRFINMIGFEAYSRTINTLKFYEEEKIPSDGDN